MIITYKYNGRLQDDYYINTMVGSLWVAFLNGFSLSETNITNVHFINFKIFFEGVTHI